MGRRKVKLADKNTEMGMISGMDLQEVTDFWRINRKIRVERIVKETLWKDWKGPVVETRICYKKGHEGVEKHLREIMVFRN